MGIAYRCLLAGLLAALAGCAVVEPQNLTCSAFPTVPQQPGATVATTVLRAPAAGDLAGVSAPRPERVTVRAPDPASDPVAAAAFGILSSRVDRSLDLDSVSRPAPPRLSYLALSTGGQWAAFGSGFMAGWSANPSRSQARPAAFDIVTGASAGATIAPAAFAGKDFDAALPFAGDVDVEGLARSRGFPGLLFANSLFDASGLERTVRASATAALVERIAKRQSEGRRLFVGAVSLQSSRFDRFDLTAEAVAGGTEARPCIAEAVLASAAIPAILPPRGINGQYYADAGLRDHLFLGDVDRAMQAVRAATGDQPVVDAFVIINGDLEAPSGPLQARLTDLARRSMSIVTDQGLRQSALNVLQFAEKRGWNVRAMTAKGVDLSPCEGALPAASKTESDALFSSCVTRILYREGFRRGSAARIDWLDAADLRRLVNEF